MAYVIEGTITEISMDKEGKYSSFKIMGTERYALQRKNEKELLYPAKWVNWKGTRLDL